MSTHWDSIWINAQLATMQENAGPYGLIENGALACKDDLITWVGPQSQLPGPPEQLADKVYDTQGQLITPGLIDCHTHLVYAGNRADEFEARLQGKSYEALALAGGGINRTVTATRQATAEQLLEESLPRATALMSEGVTTLEIKSGYGLDVDNEIKILQVARQIGEQLPLTVHTTFLGAHTCPPEYHGDKDAYIKYVCDTMLPEIATLGLADAVDAFCETIGFTLQQTEQVFEAAQKLGLPVKCHAEQLSNQNAAKLCTKYQALSADHLEYISEQSLAAMANSNTVAVLLPGAYYFLGETHTPPVNKFRSHNIPMAIATDCNPGSSPISSLQLIMNMACVLFSLTPEEALTAVTRHAAQALGIAQSRGTLDTSKVADFVVWPFKHPACLSYSIGDHACSEIIKSGKLRQISFHF